MKRYFYYLLTPLLALLAGIPMSALGQSYEIDESTTYISSSQQLSSNCTWKPEKGNDNYLPENNEAFYDKGDYLGTLLDGNQSTYWHSDPININLNTQETWIQVDLQRTDIAAFYLMLQRRNDPYNGSYRHGVFPTNISIYGTNDETLAGDESSKLADWNKLADLSELPTATDDSYEWPYYSTAISNSGNYRYIRISPTKGNNAYWCPSELQLYGATEVTDQHKILYAVVDSIYDAQNKAGISYTVGTEPGFISQADYNAYNNTFADVLNLADNASATDEQLKAGIKTIRDLEASMPSKIIRPAEGYYYIRSSWDVFQNTQKVYKQFMVNDSTNVTWGTANMSDPRQIFYLKPLEDGNYLIKHVYSGRYMSYANGDAVNTADGTYITVADTIGAEQVLQPLFNGTWYIANDKNPLPYHPLGHNNGAGVSGSIVCASVYTAASTWQLIKADSTKYQAMVDSLTRAIDVGAIYDVILPARAALVEIYNPSDKLLTSTSQITANTAMNSTTGPDQLLDGDHITHYHSDPNQDYRNTDEYLQVDLLDETHNGFVIEYWGRNDVSHPSWHDNVMAFEVKATNTPDDESSWTTITTLDKSFPAEGLNAHYVSPRITASQNYRYWRFYVRKQGTGQAYWNMSEFQLYDKLSPSEGSLYTTNADAKAAGDAIQAALTKAENDIANSTIDGTEAQGLIDAVKSFEAVKKTMENISAEVDKAQKLYDKLFVFASTGLITTVNTLNDGTNQLSANHTWTSITPDNDNYSFNQAFIEDGYNLLGTLIDNDDQTYWHSDPNTNLHYSESFLQIDLKRTDVSSFRVWFMRRNDLYNGSNRHGSMPAEIDIYGTNDDALGTDLTAACSTWNKITNLYNIPSVSNGDKWPYVSEVITPSTPYRYLRVLAANGDDAYWCMSGFQILPGDDSAYDKEFSQYYRVDGMKDAADKLAAVIKDVNAKIKANSAVLSDSTALAEAEKAVEDLWQDTTVVYNLLVASQNLVDNTVIGDNVGELADGTLIDALQEAIKAVKPYPSSTATFKANYAALQTAYDNVQKGISSIEPGKWYYILSKTADDDSAPANYYPARDKVAGTALYVLNNGGTGSKGGKIGNYYNNNQLRWGMDDIKGMAQDGDPDALWRFVPAPDSVGKGAYFIQNMHTGYYIGNCNLKNSDYYYSGSLEPEIAFNIVSTGKSEFHLVPVNGNRAGVPISFGDNARQIRGDAVADGYENRASLTFQEYPVEEGEVMSLQFMANSMRIISLPFAVSDITLNETATAYTVVGINEDHTAIAVKEKTSFAAGEPFILVLGDTTKYDPKNIEATEMLFEIPTEYIQKRDTVNGLISTGEGLKVGAGRGYISDNVLQATTKDAGFRSHGGYIDPGLITGDGADADAWIPLTGEGILNKIKTAAKDAAASAKVDVYTIDGVRVKHNVAPAEAAKGLTKGVYIIGKKKVTIK